MGRKLKPTKNEFEVVVDELAERLKDMVYVEAQPQARHMLKQLNIHKGIDESERDDNALEFTFKVGMILGDVRQIISRERRPK